MAPAGPVSPGANRLTRTGIFLARAAAVAGLLALAAAPAFAQTDVWTATLTPADFSGTLGCNNASAIATSKCSTATVLSDDDFTYDSTDYSVTVLHLTATAFTFTVDTDITAATNALTLVVGGTSLALADATNQTARKREWFNPGFSWTAGTAVSIRITGPTPIVPPDWSLKPTGLAQGSQFRLLFLSSTKRDATATDIADYNTFVQDRAEAGHTDIQGYSAGFRAVGCTADTDARDNTATTYTISDKGVPIYWLDGAKVADDYADFYDGDWDDEANDKNESGTNSHDTSQTTNFPWTGCQDDGTEATFNVNSVALGGPGGLGVRVGRPNSSATGDGPISGSLNETKTNTRPMYGLSAVFQVLVVPPSLTSAVVPADGNTIQLAFSEDLQSANLPPAAAFTVTAGGTAVTVTGVAAGTTEDVLEITVSPLIGSGQAVVVAYEDPTNGDDAKAIQDTVGNDTPGFTTGAGGVPAVTNNSTVANAVLAGWSLTPTGLNAGDQFRLLFLSSTKRDALSSDIADYNTFVQDRAAAGHADIQAYSGGFGAIGCTAAVDARDNTSTTGTGVPIYWLDGTKVADDYADFYDGSWDDEVNDKNESGTDAHDTSQEDNYPITGCANDGTESFAGAHRPRSLGAPLMYVRTGRLNSSGTLQDPIDGNHVLETNLTRPMYGLSAVFQVADAPDTTPPTLTSADVEESNGLTIYLEFSEDLQLSNPPLASAFTLTVDGSAVTGFSVARPGSSLPQNAIWLHPPTAIRQGQAVVVTYTDPTADNDTAAIQDTAGNDTPYFTTGMNSVPAVINNSTVPTAVPNNWSLKPTGLNTGDQFRLLFLSSTKRNATATAIAPYNTFIQNLAAAGHTDIRDYSAGFRVVGCTADTDARDNTATTYTTTAKGVPIYWLDGTKAADQYEDFYDGDWDDAANDKNESGTDAHDTSQTANYPYTGCSNDGTEVFGGGGTRSRALGNSVVKVGDPNGGVPIGSTQLLVASSETRPLYGLSALFQVAAAVIVNNPPEFSANTAARSVAENTAAGQNVGAVLTATDLDSDTLIYTLEGTDAASFGILSASGQIQTKAGVTYNHEAQSTYTVMVKADDSNGGTDTVTVTITVTDVNEPPGVPAAPSVTATAGSSTSLDVSWTAPTNTGPAIASYDLQYREGTSGSFTDGPQNVTGTSAAIASLTASTSHQVQVRATNAEGDGDWSFAGTGRTGNNAPVFSSSTAARSVAENTAAGQNVGAVLTATDLDSDTLIYTLEGTDAASFGILSASGQIQTKAGVTYNHEAQSTYTVMVKADDSNGGTDTVTVTITVTDVNEPPGVPAAPSVTATAGSSTSLDVSWTAPTNTGPAIASYDLQYREGTSGSFTDGPQNVTGTSTAIASLMPGTSHQVQVRATNAEGDGDWSLSGTGQTGTSVPDAPTGLTATASGTTQIDLSWTAPASDGGSAITGYKIEISSDGGNAWTTHLADTTSPATTYEHTGLAASTTRHYRVSAINTNGAGAASNVDGATTGTTVPGAPTGLAATASGNTRIDLSWTAPASDGGSAITGYKIEISSDGGNAWTTHLADTTNPNTTYAHTGLAASTTRHYRVSAINTIGTGAASNVDDATTGTTAPGAPTGLVATASGTTQIDLSWTAPASDGGSPITGYKIEESPNGNSNWTTLEADTNGPATTYSHTGLAAGTTRHYRVSAINTNGAGAASNVDGATTGTTVPDAPTGLAATASGNTRINLSWTAPASGGGSPITGYKIEESPNGNSNWTTLEADTNGPATTYSHTGLAAGATRHYRVSAINTNGAGAPSNIDDATTGTTVPDAPTSLTATASGNTRIDLTWTAPAITGGSPITGYKIEESPNGNSNWTTLEADTNGPATTYSHTGLAAGTTRHYRVSAINTNGAGAPSNIDDATTGTTVPDAPTSLTATASGNTRIDLTWTAPAITGGSPITGYKIEESPNGNSNWTTLEADTNGPATTYSHTGLAAGTTRYYRVSAINTNGAGAASNVDGATTGTTVPDAPTGLAATASGNTRINLSWTAPAITGGSPITGYKIEESPNGTSSWTDLVTDTTDTRTTYSHTGLAGGTTRHYRVSAINSNGAGAPSSVDGATTGTSVPGAPTDLSARASGTTQVDLSWTAPGSDGGSPVTGYRIEESPNGRSSWTVLVATTGSPATTYSRTGLASGATRHYRVSAVNTNGAGAPSNTASTTTGTTVPGAPTRLTAAASGTARINLSWTAPGSGGGIRITGYRIESSLGSGSSWTVLVANTGITRTTYSDTGLSGGTTRYYRVSAINTNGAGAHSNVDGATTGTTVPDAPTDLTARVSENTRINLSWTRPASDGGSLVTGYRIEISSDGGSSWTDRVANTRSPHRAYSHIVAAGATRHYRVSAISAKGTSAHSNVASATTVLRRVRFEADLYTAREGGAAATVAVAVVLSAAAPAAVTIPLTREHLSGATEADYSGVPAGVTFAAGQARQTFTVTVTEDSDEDGLKRLRLQFGTLPSGYASDPPRTAVVRLVDNDGGLLVDFGTERHTTVQVREHADVRHRFSVYLRTNRYGPPNNNRQQSLTIPLVVQHVGGAEEDVDYTPRIPASVTFAAGQSQASFSIRAIPDGERESGEGLRIDFGPLPSGVARGIWEPYETIEFLDAGAPASANLSVAGRLLTLGYPGALDGGSTPSPRDFVVSAEAPGGEKAMAPVAAVSVRGSDVFLQLARPVLPDETVTLSYLADAMHPIREAAGLPAPPLTDAPVRNDTPASGPGPEAGLPVQAGIPAAMAVLPEEAPVGAQTQRLDLSSRNLTDLSALAGLTGLRELDLRDNAVEELWPLAGLTGLRVLHLSGNRIADLSPLAGLTALEQLSLAGNRIADLRPLAGLTGLERLHLSANRIGDLAAGGAERARAAEPGRQSGRRPRHAGATERTAGAGLGRQPDRGTLAAGGPDGARAAEPVRQSDRGTLAAGGAERPRGPAAGPQPGRRPVGAFAAGGTGKPGAVGEPDRGPLAAGGARPAPSARSVGQRRREPLGARRRLGTGLAAAARQPGLGRGPVGAAGATALAVARLGNGGGDGGIGAARRPRGGTAVDRADAGAVSAGKARDARGRTETSKCAASSGHPHCHLCRTGRREVWDRCGLCQPFRHGGPGHLHGQGRGGAGAGQRR